MESYGFESLPSFATISSSTRLQILFDEVREQDKGRSLLDGLEDLAAVRTVTSSKESALSSMGALVCEDAQSILAEGQAFSTFAENFAPCSSMDLDSLFSTAAVVGNGESVDVETFFNAKIQRSLESSLRSLLHGNFRSALNDARLVGYAPCARATKKFVSTVYVPTSKGLSPLAIKTFACGSTTHVDANVLVEIPHPFFDHTRAEGLALFDSGFAKALIMSGTHRCAVAPASGCTGSVGKAVRTNCGPGRAEYQNGDTAHAVDNTFHVAHVALSDAFPDSVVVSLHATKQETFIVSDGTSHEVMSSAPVAKVVTALAKHFPSVDIASCNSFSGSPSKRTLSESEKDVCGATNVQGRHLNGAPDACRAKIFENGSPLKSSGRFVHIEQPVTLVKGTDQTLIKGISGALKEAFAS